MRKIILLSVLCVSVLLNIQAQDRSIRFENTRVWKDIVEKAKKEKKLIFVDCFTSWCVPCKNVVTNVFSKNEVADFFNKTFVCAHFDIEKDPDGAAFFKRIEGEAVPTLSFIDPETEDIVYQIVGAVSKDQLIEQAKIALDPQNNLVGLTKRFKNGEQDTAFLNHYFDLLETSYLKARRKQAIEDYLNSLPEEQFVSTEIWKMVKANTKTPLDAPFKRVMKLREKFYRELEQEEVDNYLTGTIIGTVETLTDGRMHSSVSQEHLDTLKMYLSSLHYPAVPSALARLEVGDFMRNGDFQGMLSCMREALDANLFVTGDARLFFIDNIGKLALCKDSVIINKGIVWLDEECNSTQDELYQANLMHVKVDLLKYLGKKEEALQTAKREDAFFKEAIKKSGMFIIRAFKTYGTGPGGRIL